MYDPRSPDRESVLYIASARAKMAVSQFNFRHDDQIVTIRRGDLKALISLAKGPTPKAKRRRLKKD